MGSGAQSVGPVEEVEGQEVALVSVPPNQVRDAHGMG